MAGNNIAPTLLKIGDKDQNIHPIGQNNWGKAIRSHELEMILFNELGDRAIAQLKLMLFLTGNACDGSFSVPEETVLTRCHIGHSGYLEARKALIEKGWLEYDQYRSIKVNYNRIYADGKHLFDNSTTQSETTSKKNQKISTQSETTSATQSETTSSTQSETTLNNINNNKKNTIIENSDEFGSWDKPVVESKEWLQERYAELVPTAKRGVFLYAGKYYEVKNG